MRHNVRVKRTFSVHTQQTRDQCCAEILPNSTPFYGKEVGKNESRMGVVVGECGGATPPVNTSEGSGAPLNVHKAHTHIFKAF